MPPLPLSFAIRFLIFVAVVFVLHIVVGAGLVLLALFGLSLAPLSASGVIVLAVAMGLLIGLLIAIIVSPVAIANIIALPVFAIGIAALVTIGTIAGLVATGTITVGLALVLIALIGLAALFVEAVWFVFGVHRLPLGLLGVRGLTSMPGVPFRLAELPDTIIRLLNRSNEIQPAKDGLSTNFTLGTGPNAKTATGQTFMFGAGESRSLSDPLQYAMGWTTLDSIDRRAADLAPAWSSSLMDPAAATEQFWPTIARFSTPFNIVPLERVTAARATVFRGALGAAWTPAIEAMFASGTLHAIDMTMFASLDPPTTAIPRFTPVTLTLLDFAAATQTLAPILVSVSNGAATQIYVDGVASPSAWLYALQAAKVSITVWGIWIGHVYR